MGWLVYDYVLLLKYSGWSDSRPLVGCESEAKRLEMGMVRSSRFVEHTVRCGTNSILV